MKRPSIIVESPVIYQSPQQDKKEEDSPPPATNSSLSSSAKASNSSAALVIMLDSKDYKASIVSIRRTLKKCNLKSIKPEIIEEFKAKEAIAYSLNIPENRHLPVLKLLVKNWISIDQAKIQGFFTRRQGKFVPIHPNNYV